MIQYKSIPYNEIWAQVRTRAWARIRELGPFKGFLQVTSVRNQVYERVRRPVRFNYWVYEETNR